MITQLAIVAVVYAVGFLSGIGWGYAVAARMTVRPRPGSTDAATVWTNPS